LPGDGSLRSVTLTVLRCGERVHSVGVVDRPRKAWPSSNAASFVLSIRDGGFSTAILEAPSRGIPTVVDSE
jgi:hypothetical protein